jgi:hypothetical protein
VSTTGSAQKSEIETGFRTAFEPSTRSDTPTPLAWACLEVIADQVAQLIDTMSQKNRALLLQLVQSLADK